MFTRAKGKKSHVTKIGSTNFMKKLIFLSGILFAFVGGSVLANDVQVFSTVDRNAMGAGDTFVFKITVSSSQGVNVAPPTLPNLSDFDLLNSWTGMQSQSIFTNGQLQVQQSRVFNYMLAPKKTGRLVLGGASVQVNDRIYNTKPITIEVSESSPQPDPQEQNDQLFGGLQQDPLEAMEDAFSQLLQRQGGGGFQTQPTNPNEAFFIQLQVDKTKAYEGEMIKASWYLYTRGQIRDIDTLKYPSLNGFWKEEIELATRLDFQQEVVNGIVYKKALLASFALFPIKAGSATIDSYKAKCTVITPSNFGFGRPYQATKASKPLKIEVLPIPQEGRPQDYSGAVGNYEVKTSLDPLQAQVNQPVTYKVRFEGRGNAKLIDLPALNLPPSLEQYDTKVDAKYFPDGRSYKEFEVLLIPREPGQFAVPSLSVSLFDPQKAQFYQRKTEPFNLTVSPGTNDGTIDSSPLAKNQPTKQAQPARLPDLSLAWDGSQGVGWTSQVWFWSTGYFLALLLLGWRWAVEFEVGKGKRDLDQLLQVRMQKMRKSLDQGDWRHVGVQGTNSLYSILGEISGEGGASHELEKLLQKAPPSLRRELGEELAKLLNYFETISFAPEEVVGTLKEKNNLKANVNSLEKCLHRAIALAVKEMGDPKSAGSSSRERTT